MQGKRAYNFSTLMSHLVNLTVAADLLNSTDLTIALNNGISDLPPAC